MRLQNELLEHSVKSLADELHDVCAERDVFQQKAHRLNVEMNHIVGSDDARILDVDALCMENRSAASIGSNVVIRGRDFLKGQRRIHPDGSPLKNVSHKFQRSLFIAVRMNA